MNLELYIEGGRGGYESVLVVRVVSIWDNLTSLNTTYTQALNLIFGSLLDKHIKQEY